MEARVGFGRVCSGWSVIIASMRTNEANRLPETHGMFELGSKNLHTLSFNLSAIRSPMGVQFRFLNLLTLVHSPSDSGIDQSRSKVQQLKL